jgi:NAD(P)-dependent dehydrogenase (short-subunit alcohol dehydrogenase family)
MKTLQPEASTEAGWALILGVSGALGSASARAFIESGYSVYGVYLDIDANAGELRALQPFAESHGRSLIVDNANALRAATIARALDCIRERGATVRVLLHAMAGGVLGAMVPTRASGTGNGSENNSGSQSTPLLTAEQIESTCRMMAHSLVTWAQAVTAAGLWHEQAKVYAFTSIGSTHVVPAYGAVAAAKAALEAHIRQLAVELAPRGVAVNAIRASVTDTRALRQIPNCETILECARRGNPHGRLSVPEDIAMNIAALSRLPGSWMTGNVIGVDGGEILMK